LWQLTKKGGVSLVYNSQETYAKIKFLSKTKKISINTINEVAGLGENAISQSAKSQDGMKAKNLYAISEALDCSVDYLLGRTDNVQAHKCESSVSIGDISGNSGTIGVGNVITNAAPPNGQAAALLELFNNLDPIKQAQLVVYANELTNK